MCTGRVGHFKQVCFRVEKPRPVSLDTDMAQTAGCMQCHASHRSLHITPHCCNIFGWYSFQVWELKSSLHHMASVGGTCMLCRMGTVIQA